MQSFILFNGLKHHRHTVRNFVQDYDLDNFPQIATALLPVGHSLMDLYVGELSEIEIYREITENLFSENIVSEAAYRQFLHPHHYRTLTLNDTSQWVLRLGEKNGRYVHIHPGRHSPHTLRVKATTLKTAIAVLVWQRQSAQPLDTPLLNRLRTETLGLSPVRDLSEADSVLRVMGVLNG
jgi:hypothetical protein